MSLMSVCGLDFRSKKSKKNKRERANFNIGYIRIYN